jgi:nucleoid DNA-binding protein
VPVKKTTKKTAAKKTTRKAARRAITQAQLIDAISEDTGFGKSDIKHVLTSMEEQVTNYLQNVDKVKIGNLVQLEVRKVKARKSRMGRNPRTGEDVKIAAKPASVKVAARVLVGAKRACPTLAKANRVLG